MVIKRVRPAAVLSLLRRHARRHQCRLLVDAGRGKGSHQLVTMVDEDGQEIGRAALPIHVRELSWTVRRSIGAAFATPLGERWMEER